MQPSTVRIVTTFLVTCQKGHSWNVPAEQTPGGGIGVGKYALDYMINAAMQSIGSGSSAADTILAHLNITGTNNFFSNLSKVRKTNW